MVCDNPAGIDLREAPLIYTANRHTNDYVGRSFKIREDLLPLAEGVLLPHYELLERAKELCIAIERDYRGENPLFIPILKGAVRFSQDLFRFSREIDPEYEFMSASSYGKRLESGEVELDLGSMNRLLEKLKDQDRPVILVEDIVDTGNTLAHIVDVLLNIDEVIDSQPEFRDFQRRGSYRPSDVAICTLLDKPSRREPANGELPVKYLGFTIPNHWVFGYGLDVWGDKSRTLDHLCVLKDDYKQDCKLEEFFELLERKRKKKK